MAIVQYDDGLKINFNGQPTPQDIEEAHSQATGTADPVMQSLNNLSDSMNQPDLPQTQSPLKFVDSLKLGLLTGDNKGQEDLLKSKFKIVHNTQDGNFLVGDNPGALEKVNPEGLTNDIPAKIAQGIGTINTITGSIIGATVGGVATAEAGGVGAIPGSAVGAEVGTGFNKLIGKALGINKQSPESIATDIAIDGALYGAGEALGMGFNALLKSAGNKIASKGVGIASDLLKDPTIDAASRAKRVSQFANIINFGTGWGKDDITTAIVNGPIKTFEKESTGPLANIIKGSDDHMTNLVDRLKGFITNEDDKLSKSVGVAAKKLHGSLNTESAEHVMGVDYQNNIMNTLKQFGWGTPGFTEALDSSGKVIRNDYIKLNILKDDKEATELINKLRGHFKAFGGEVSSVDSNILTINPEAKVSLEQLFARRSVLQQQLDKSADDSLSKKAFAILKSGDRYSVDPKTGIKSTLGVEDGIANIAKQVGDKDYLASVDTLAKFRSSTDALEEAGLHWSKPRAIQETIKAGVEDNAVLKRALSNFDSNQNTNWSNQIAMWKSARSATNLNPNYLRFNFVMGLTGLAALKQDTWAGKLGYAGAGMMLATPGGAAAGLRLAEKSGILNSLLNNPIKRNAAKVGLKGGGELIRRLVTQSSVAGTKNKLTSKSQ